VSDFERPAWLEKALAERAAPSRRTSLQDSSVQTPPAVGQLRVLRHWDPRITADRLGLIVDVEESLAVARFLLVSPLTEYRTAVDYLLEPADSGSTMRLIVECDLRGAVWYPSQMGRSVGVCTPGLAAGLDAVGGGALPVDVGLAQSRFGLPARDDRDPRWAWKLSEFDELTSLTHECDEWLFSDERGPGIFDPALLEELAGLSQITQELALSLASLVTEYDAATTGDRDSLNALFAIMEKVDHDERDALRQWFERELTRMPAAKAGSLEQVTLEPPPARRTADVSSLPGAIVSRTRETHHCAVVITSPRAWTGKLSGTLDHAVANVADEERRQVTLIDFYSQFSEVAA